MEDLHTHFDIEGQVAKAVNGVSFEVYGDEVFGLVGESGCGKSVTALSILRLIPSPPGSIAGGRILFRGKDLLTLPLSEMRRIRGNRIAMIFQEPMTALDPVFTIGSQLREAIDTIAPSSRARRPTISRWRCSSGSASPTRAAGSAATRTSSRAACASA